MNTPGAPVPAPAAVLDAVRAGRVTPTVSPRTDPLTARQRQIMLILLRGRTAAQAARELGISANTVSRTVQEAYKRLGVHNRLQAALALGVIGAGVPEDLRHLVARALADHDQAGRGLDQGHYRAEEWLCCADAVLAVLDAQFPPMLALDPPPELSPEQVAAWQAQWSEAVSGDTRQRLMIRDAEAGDSE